MKSTYNTRRKSVSLTALGVQLPGRSRASTESKHDSSNTDSHAHSNENSSSPPSKRVKTSHSPSSPGRSSPNRPASRPRKGSEAASAAVDQAKSKSKHADTTNTTASSRPKSRQLEYTPPPSPADSTEAKIDYDSIKDDIVEGVVTQLEKTGNRPHLIRELAAVLATTNDSVTSSANAPALLSSRLASFMKRSCWSSSNPCPVGKELIPVHPRKVFYYLTDRSRQELPDTSDDIYGPLGITSPTTGTAPVVAPTNAGVGVMGPPPQLPLKRSFEPVISKFHNDSPPLSNASATGDDDSTTNADERRERWAPSPSPEVDLTIHDAHSEYGDEPADKAGKKDGNGVRQSVHNVSRGHGFKHELEPPRQLHLNTRAQSPQVEHDEGNFRDMVVSMRNSPPKEPPTPVENKMEGVVKEEDRETRRLPEYEMDSYASVPQIHHVSSPAFPAQAATFTPKQAAIQVAKTSSVEDVLMADDSFGSGLYQWDLNAPKDIDVDELDLLLEGC